MGMFEDKSDKPSSAECPDPIALYSMGGIEHKSVFYGLSYTLSAVALVHKGELRCH